MKLQKDSVAVAYKNACESKWVTSMTSACDTVVSSEQWETVKLVQ